MVASTWRDLDAPCGWDLWPSDGLFEDGFQVIVADEVLNHLDGEANWRNHQHS